MKPPVLAAATLLAGLTLCVMLLLPLYSSAVFQDRFATQTTEKNSLDEYMTIYSPGGITGVPPSLPPSYYATLKSILTATPSASPTLP